MTENQEQTLFVGHTRFSLLQPRSSAWFASNGSAFTDKEEYAAYLFSDERLEPRMRILLECSIPQLSAAIQAVRNQISVRHVISFSSELPARYREQLAEAAKRFPFLVLDEHVGGAGRHGPFAVARAEAAGDRTIFGLYRLDDDDVLATDYFEQMLQHVRPGNEGYIVSLSSGYTGIYQDGDIVSVRRCHAPMIAIGLLKVCVIEADGQVRAPEDTSHREADRMNPVILDARKPAWLWTRHPLQDTSLAMGPKSADGLIREIYQSMDRYHGIPASSTLGATFPVLDGRRHEFDLPGPRARQEWPELVDLQEEPLILSMQPLQGTFVLAADVWSEPLKTGNHVVASLTLSHPTASIEDLTDRELQAAGLSRSPNSEIGTYCYLPLAQEPVRRRRLITLPQGWEVRGLSLRRFGAPGLRVRTQAVSLEQRREAS